VKTGGRSRRAARSPLAAASVFTALGDPTRLYLVTRLCQEGPLSISSLAAGTTVTRQAVTKHLNALAAIGLARSGRHGREQRWRIEAERLDEVRRLLNEISSQWDQAIGRLKGLVEEP
jgi:DNA-binding transcriptional ArsR family regulator